MYHFPFAEPLIIEHVFSMAAASKMGLKSGCYKHSEYYLKYFPQEESLNFAFLCQLKIEDTILNLK